jgi:uncharacterized membrane protein YccC
MALLRVETLMRQPVRHLFAFGPHNAAHKVAIRAGLSMAVPLLALWALGRMDLAMYATFGAFAALYGRFDPHRVRIRMQLGVGVWLVLAVTVGAAIGISPAHDWLVIPVVATAGAGASLLSDKLRWHPPGPLFTVFALAACASLPTEAARVPLALAAAASSAALAVVIGGVGYARPRARRHHDSKRSTRMSSALTRPAVRMTTAARFGIAVVVSGTIPTITGLGHPYWAMVAAVAAVSGPDVTSRLARAGHRVLGTLAGVMVATAILGLALPPLAIIAVVAFLQIGAELVVGRNYALALMFVTPLALLMVELAHHIDAMTLVRDRAFETLLGAMAGIVITMIEHTATSRRYRGGPSYLSSQDGRQVLR